MNRMESTDSSIEVENCKKTQFKPTQKLKSFVPSNKNRGTSKGVTLEAFKLIRLHLDEALSGLE